MRHLKFPFFILTMSTFGAKTPNCITDSVFLLRPACRAIPKERRSKDLLSKNFTNYPVPINKLISLRMPIFLHSDRRSFHRSRGI
jgi:hypothetical protein